LAKSNLRNLSLTSVDDLFETDESRKELNREKVIEIPLTEIDDFPDHPFKVRIDEAMQEMVESIKNRGVLTPATVRKKEDGRYELISGHRRKKACELAGIDKLPVIVKEMSKDEAIIFMVDSNLQRDIILPSEKAFSYKMRLEAMKRQGERTDLTSNPLGGKFAGKESAEIIADKAGESSNQIRRYIRLTELIPEVLQMTDEKRIAFQPAVMISYLPKEQQKILHKTMDTEDCTPSLAQTQRMKKLSDDGRLNEDVIFTILTEEKPNQKEKLTLNDERFDKYFPKSYTTQQKEELLAKLLESWWQKQRQQQER
jgi:ParB family chromosome partitioning protein